MGQRIDDPFDQALVELGRLALGDQTDALAQLGGVFPHHTRKTAEDVIHRHHADGHHGLLEIARIAFQLLDAIEQAIVQHRIQRL